MENEPINIKVDDQAVTTRVQPRSRKSGPGLLTIAVVLLLSIFGGALMFWPRQAAIPPSNVASSDTSSEKSNQSAPPAVEEPSETSKVSLADDGESLWASPTAGQPIDCSYLLPGTQLILHVRVAELLAHREGEKVSAALGPWGQQVTAKLTELTEVEFSALDTLLLGIRQSHDGSLEYALRLELLQPMSRENACPSCFLPEFGESKLLVWCTNSALAELKSQNGQPPLFSRELSRVVERTDTQRMATLVFSGKFLQISGEKFLRGAGEKLQTAIVDFLGDEATASAVSAHWDENFFVELLSTVALNERPHRFAKLLQQRVSELSDQVEDSLLAQQLPPYGRKVLGRFPAMLRKLSNYTRSGEDNKLSLLRCYLPDNAGHNLLMASELLVNRAQISTVGTTKAVSAAPTQQPPSLTARLQQSTSLVFPKESLQKALEILSEDLNVPIQIAGNDLQLEGITKNQSLAIDLRDRPAAEILLEVLLRANPDRTASGPGDVKQKLVYVIREPEDKQPSAIVVTTRSAAKRRGEKLPQVFEPAPR